MTGRRQLALLAYHDEADAEGVGSSRRLREVSEKARAECGKITKSRTPYQCKTARVDAGDVEITSATGFDVRSVARNEGVDEVAKTGGVGEGVEER